MENTLYFGGSFNPIHNGHLLTAIYVAEKLKVKRVMIIPCKTPYHKTVDMATYETRLLMCHMATRPLGDLFRVSDADRFTVGNSYTYDLLQKLTNNFQFEPLWLIGSDNAHSVPEWHKFDELRNKVKFIIVDRNQQQKIELTKEPGHRFDLKLPYKHEIISTPQFEISSTEIRKRIKEQRSIACHLPHMVEDIIRMENLYSG